MTITGQVTHHLMRARELLARRDSTSDAERLAVEALLFQLDCLLLAVRSRHHRVTLRRGGHDDP